MPFGTVYAGLDVALRQVDAVQAQPCIDGRGIETDHAFFADLHQGPTNEQRVPKQQMQRILAIRQVLNGQMQMVGL